MEHTWKCPKCGSAILWSYEDIAERGNPICNFCDTEMELEENK